MCRFHYGCDVFLHFLCDCVKLVYASQQVDVLPLKSVYDMLLAHSQYLPTMLGKHSSCKGILVVFTGNS